MMSNLQNSWFSEITWNIRQDNKHEERWEDILVGELFKESRS